MRKCLLVLLVAMTTFECYAGEWTGEMTVKEIVAGYKPGYLVFKVNEEFHNPNNCAAGLYVVHPDDANVDHTLKMLLSAKAMGQAISFAVSTSKCSSIANYPTVTRLKIL